MLQTAPEHAPLCGKILLIITEDWFALSHFKPLIKTLAGLAREVVVATRSSGRFGEIEALGARVVPLDAGRGSVNPLRQGVAARELIAILRAERPDAIHAIALQPMVLAALALRFGQFRPAAVMLHLTGLGLLGVASDAKARATRGAAFWIMRQGFTNSNAWGLAENSDDTGTLVSNGIVGSACTTVVPGAGIDVSELEVFPPPANSPPVAAYVGRMLKQKGLAVLVSAQQRLWNGGTQVKLELYGESDALNASAIPRSTLEEWTAQPGISWHGHVTGIGSVWRGADIAAVPTLGGEGMPRAMLEAAACGCPLIVSDVPGCRHFVRHGEEGLVVPPGNVTALAEALGRLASDPDLRRRMGRAARKRVAEGYTTETVHRAVENAYRAVLHGVRCHPGV